MFSKKKKKPQISAPANFEHRVHTGFDKREGKYVGLPLQWASIVGNNQILKSSNRPLPLVDPSDITPIEINDLKTIVRPHHPGMHPMREGSMTPVPGQMMQMQPPPTNGLVLPKTSAVARSNSLRSSSPPRIRRDLRGAMANVPPAVPEEGGAPTPTPMQMQSGASGMRPAMGMGPTVPGKMPLNKPQPPLPGMPQQQMDGHPGVGPGAPGAGSWDRNHNSTFMNGNGGAMQSQMPPQMPQINVQTDMANNNYLRQQVSPGSGIIRQNNISPRGPQNPQIPPQLPPHQVANSQHLINMQQQKQQQQHLLHHPYNNNNNGNATNPLMMKPNSRASSSSGGNLSVTAPSIIGGGGSGAGHMPPHHPQQPLSAGPSPTNTAGGGSSKQEQRLTHEEFRKALQMVVSGGDPRENLENFMKIGEGSTGTVCIATDRTTGE